MAPHTQSDANASAGRKQQVGNTVSIHVPDLRRNSALKRVGHPALAERKSPFAVA
jgi:hypothetical protein